MTAAEYNKKRKKELEEGAASGISSAPSAYTPGHILTAAEYNAGMQRNNGDASWSDVSSDLVLYQKALEEAEKNRYSPVSANYPPEGYSSGAAHGGGGRSFGTASEDVRKAQEKVDALQAQVQAGGSMPVPTTANMNADYYGTKKAAANSAGSQLSKAKAELQTAQWAAELEGLTKSAQSDPMFKSYASSGRSGLSGDYEYSGADPVHAAQSYASSAGSDASAFLNKTPAQQRATSGYDLIYRYMEPEEVDTYDYWVGKEKRGEADKGTAARYLNLLEDTLNQRRAAAMYEEIGGSSAGTATQLGVKAQTGFNQSGSGIMNSVRSFTNPNAVPSTSAQQYLGAQVQADLKEKGRVPAVAGDLITTTTNMLPSIAASFALGTVAPAVVGATGAEALAFAKAGAVAGQAVMGAGVFGNAYNEMRKQGYSDGQSKLYASMNTASELALEKLLNGVAGMGLKSVTGKTVEDITKGMNSAAGQWFIRHGADMLSEGFEEFSQDVLDPLLKGIATGDYSEQVDWTQALYSGLLGVLNAGALNGIGDVNRQALTLYRANTLKKSGGAVKAVELGRSYSAESIAGQLAQKLAAKTDANGNIDVSTWELAHLIAAEGAYLTEQTANDIAAELQKRGYAKENAEDVASFLAAAVVDGAGLSRAQWSVINGDETISEVFADVVLNRNTTVNQRLANYEEVGRIGGWVSAETETDPGVVVDSMGAEQSVAEARQNAAQTQVAETAPDTAAQAAQSAQTQTQTRTQTEERKAGTDYDTDEGRTVLREVVGSQLQKLFKPETASERETAQKKVNAITEIMTSPSTAAVLSDAGIDIETAVSGMTQAAKYGIIGVTRENWSAQSEARKIPQGIADTIWNVSYGYNNGAVKSAAKTRGTFTMPANYSSLSKIQKTSVMFAKKLHDAGLLAQNVRFYQSVRGEDGNFRYAEDVPGLGKAGDIAANGGYVQNGDTIYIDVNAGNAGEGAVVSTLAHELVHSISAKNAAQFRKLADAVADVARKAGIDIDAEIRRASAQSEGGAMSYSAAYEEVAADAMSRMWVENNGAIERLGRELKARDNSLYNAVRNFFVKVANALKKLYRSTGITTGERQRLAYLCAHADEVIEAFTQGVVEQTRDVAAETTNKAEIPDVVDTVTAADALDYSDAVFSQRVTDKKTLDFLNGQDTIKTYRAMQLVDGKLFPPMAAVVKGQYEDASEYGVWEQAVEHPEYAVWNGKSYVFNLQKKGKDKGAGESDVKAAYNPYMHSSNDVLNDQFSGVFQRKNLVTVECEIPVSELTSGYHAEKAKDAVGMHDWHSGTVAGQLRRAGGFDRKVYLTRWIKPIRRVPDAEVAERLAELFKGRDLYLPFNVFTEGVREELLNRGIELSSEPSGGDYVDPWLEKANAPAEAEGVKYSIRSTKEGNVVVLDEDITKKKPANQRYTDFIKEYLADVFSDDSYLSSLPESGFSVYAHDDLPEEYTDSVYTKYLRNRKQDRFYAKMMAAGSLAELVKIATGRTWEPAKHKDNKDAHYGIYKYKSRFAFPIADTAGKNIGFRAYTCDLVVINASNGNKYLYDVQNIKEDATTAGELSNMDTRKGKAQLRDAFITNLTTSPAESQEVSEKKVKKSERSRQRDADDITQTQQFKRWFGDWENDPDNASKIVDENGKPLVVYHGTDAEFTVFDRSLGRPDMDIQGMFFSPDRDDAGGYGTKVGAYYLSIKNPADFMTAFSALKKFRGQNDAGIKARDYLISLGYDGVNNDGEEYIAFYPEQIKSATDNIGTFDRANPDIRYSQRVQERDAEYMRAVEAGDTETQDRLVAEAAKEAGYTVKAYHGTTEFGFTRLNAKKGKFSNTFWLTDNPWVAGTYSDTFSRETNEPIIRRISDTDESSNGIYATYINTEGFLEVDAKGKRFYNIRFNKQDMSSDEVARYAAEHGYKGVVIYNLRDNGGISKRHIGTPSTVYGAFSPEAQIKSADPVTYDDKGNVIPLSERFNAEKSDIRYSRRDQAVIEARQARGKIRASITREINAIREALPTLIESSTETVLNPKSVKEVALRVANGDKRTALAVAEAYRRMYARMKKGEQYSWDDFEKDAKQAAEYIAQSSYDALTAEGQDDEREVLKREIRGMTVSFSENDKKLLREVFGPKWNGLLMGKIKVRTYQQGRTATAKDVFAEIAGLTKDGEWAGDTTTSLNDVMGMSTDDQNGAVNLVEYINGLYDKTVTSRATPRVRRNEAIEDEMLMQAYRSIWDGMAEIATTSAASAEAQETADRLEAEFKRLVESEKNVSEAQLEELRRKLTEDFEERYDRAQERNDRMIQRVRENAKAQVTEARSEVEQAQTELEQAQADAERSAEWYEAETQFLADWAAAQAAEEGNRKLEEQRQKAAKQLRAERAKGKAALKQSEADAERSAEWYEAEKNLIVDMELAREHEIGQRKLERQRAMTEKAKADAAAKIQADKLLLAHTKEKLLRRLEEERVKARWDVAGERFVSEIETGREVARVREAYRKREAGKRATQVRRKIKSIVQDLLQTAKTPSERKFVPLPLLESAERLAELIDTDGENPNSKVAQKRAADIEAVTALAREYRRLNEKGVYSEEYTEEYSQSVSDLLDALTDAVGQVPLRNMSSDQLNEVLDLVDTIASVIKFAGKQIGRNEAITNYQAGQRIIGEMDDIKAKKLYTGKLADIIREWTLNPMRAVRELTAYRQDSELRQLFEELNEGQRKADAFIMDARRPFDQLREDNLDAYREAAEKPFDFGLVDINGKKLKISKMQAMQLVLTYEREQANEGRAHLQQQTVIPDIDLQRKGDYAGAKDNAQRIAPVTREMVDRILSKLNSFDLYFMQEARRYYNETSKDAINYVAAALQHKLTATENEYIPYVLDRDYIASEPENIKFDATIMASGFLQAVVKNANQPLVMSGLDVVLSKSIRDTAKVFGLAIPVRNLNKALNVRQTYEDGGRTVKSAISDTWNAGAVKMLQQAIADVQAERQGTSLPIFETIRGAFVQSTLASNISVWLKQFASYPAAGAILSAKALSKGLTRFAKEAKDLPALYERIDDAVGAAHWMRRQGMAGPEALDGNPGNWASAVNEKLGSFSPMNLIQNMDVWTTAALFCACEAELEAQGIAKDAPNYKKKLSELYNNVIEETQPVYDKLHRAEVSKTKSDWLKSVVMFQTQPLQNSGILHDAAMQVRAAAKQYTKKSDQYRQAQQNFQKAVGSQIASQFTFTAFTLIGALLLHKMGRYSDDDDELTAESILREFVAQFGENVFSAVVPVVGSMAISIAQKMINNTRYDIVSDALVDKINDLIEAFAKLRKPTPEAFEKLLFEILSYFGVPAQNAKNIVKGARQNFEEIAKWVGKTF